MSAYEELLRFIRESRDRISDVQANNHFGVLAADVAEERATLDIIVSRYKAISEGFMQNTRAMQATVRPGTHPMTDEQTQIREEAVYIQRELRLEVRCFYVFAKILLDKIARFIEFYFGQARRLSLGSHDKLTRNLAEFCSAQGLSLPKDFLDTAGDLKGRVSDYRDKQIAHDQGGRLEGTGFNESGETRLVRSGIGPGPLNEALDSEPLPNLTEALDEYVTVFLDFLKRNESKARLPLRR